MQNAATGEIVASLAPEKKADREYFIHGFSSDGSKLFSAFAKNRSGAAVVRILDAKSLKTIKEFQPNISTALYSVADDCSRIVFINQDKKVEVWNAITGKLERTLIVPGMEKAGQARLFLSPDHHYLAFGLTPKRDPAKLRALRMGEGVPGELPPSALVLVDLSGTQPARKISIPPGPFRELAFSPDSKTLAMAMHGTVYLIDLPQ